MAHHPAYKPELMEQEDVDDMWRELKFSLVEELNGNPRIFDSAKQYASDFLGPNRNYTDAMQFLDTLENNINSRYDVIEFLSILTDILNIYGNVGTSRFCEMIEEFQQKVADIDQKTLRTRIWIRDRDQNFTGRSADIQEILKYLKGEKTFSGHESEGRVEVKAVVICGLGGMGKTTVAKEVCYSLRRFHGWKLRMMDLRDKQSVVDFLRDGLTALGETCPGDDPEALMEQFFTLARETRQNMALLVDNIDDILEAEGEYFIQILEHLIQLLITTPGNKLKLIITVREKMAFHDSTDNFEIQQVTSKLGRLVAEYELQQLKENEAIELLRKCTKSVELDRKEVESIVRLCAHTPLAIVTIAKTLQFGFVTAADIIRELKPGAEGAVELLHMKNCLDQTFRNMNAEIQKQFYCLKVFHATPFYIDAASSVIGQSNIDQMTITLLCLKSRHLIEIDDLSKLDDVADTKIDLRRSKKRNIVYSLHPLVAQYLTEMRGENFVDLYKEAEKKFVAHFMRVINKVYREQERDCLKGVALLNDNRTHITTLYDILLSGTDKDGLVLSDNLLGNQHPLISGKNLTSLAGDIITVSKQLLLFERLAKREECAGNIPMQIFWMTKLAEQNIRQERTELANSILTQVELKEEQLKAYEESISTPVWAEYCYVKGLWHKLGNTMDCFMRCLSCMLMSKGLYEKCQPAHIFRSTMAHIVNAVGCAYYKMNDLENSRTYHQRAIDIIKERAPGGLHLDISTYEANLASVLHKEGISCEDAESRREKLSDALNYYTDCIKKDRRLKLHKLNSHAQKLKNRADVYMHLEMYDPACNDARHSIGMRRSILIPTHTDIALGTHKLAQILYKKGSKELSEGKSEDGQNSLEEARMYYEETKNLIQYGGLPASHQDYETIKEEYRSVLDRLGQMESKWPEIQKFFSEYESGKFQSDNKRLTRQIDRALHQRARNRTVADEMSESEEESSSSSDDEFSISNLPCEEISSTDDLANMQLSPSNTGVEPEPEHATKRTIANTDFTDEPPTKRIKGELENDMTTDCKQD